MNGVVQGRDCCSSLEGAIVQTPQSVLHSVASNLMSSITVELVPANLNPG